MDDVTVLSVYREGLRFRSESQGHPGQPTEATDCNCRDLVKCFLDVRNSQGGLNAIESELHRSKRLECLIGSQKPSADRTGDVFCLIPSEQLRVMLSGINHQLGRNKVLGKEGPLRFAALEEHEFFPSRHRCCKEYSQRKIKIHGQEVIEYYHRGISLSFGGIQYRRALRCRIGPLWGRRDPYSQTVIRACA
jgi:hypothetical protein